MNLYQKWVIYRYKKVGLLYGDMLSYIFIAGKAVGFDRVERKFNKLEKKITEMGFIKLEIDDFVSSGGYGKPLPEIKRK